MSKTSQLGLKPIVPIENPLWGGNNKVRMDCIVVERPSLVNLYRISMQERH